MSTVFGLAPFFLSTNLPLERGYPFIGVFELAPLRDWIRETIGGHVFGPAAHGEVRPPPDPPKKKSFLGIKFYSELFFFLRLSGFVYDFSSCPVFLVHEFAAGGGYPFIGVFELAPLRDWKRETIGGRFFVHQPMERSGPLHTLRRKNLFFWGLNKSYLIFAEK